MPTPGSFTTNGTRSTHDPASAPTSANQTAPISFPKLRPRRCMILFKRLYGQERQLDHRSRPKQCSVNCRGYTTGIYNPPIPAHTTIFLSNRSQAIRLPKAVAFGDNVREVTILQDGQRRIIVPTDMAWDDFFNEPGVDLGERHQPPAQVRDSF
jgi:antitoxin VapB